MDKLKSLYKSHFGRPAARIENLPKAGSNRHYVRFVDEDGQSVIGVVSPDVAENQCFIYLSRHFASQGLPVPEVMAVSSDATAYLQTDLGRTSLYQMLSEGRETGGQYSEQERQLISRTLRLLPHLQVTGAKGLDAERLLPPRTFDERAAMYDFNYFKYCFLRPCDLAFDENRFEDDLLRMAHDLVAPDETAMSELSATPTFLYRDFQARNVMMPDGKPYFIDFQGGRMGPLQYDLASFLWQASARYPQTLRESLIADYLDELHTLCRFDEEQFRSRLHLFVLFRIMQVLGAYGLRGYFERKQYFLDSIPAAIQNLRRQLLDGVATPYPYLEETLWRLADMPRFSGGVTDHTAKPVETQPANPPRQSDSKPALRVRVFSFSYKKGIPEDTSGNGGGYVFDCRSTHNPGRYAPYKTLTGLDEPVIKFLEDDGEIVQFLNHVYALADHHVDTYIRRGFTDLMFSFGCTGGQHRSVYCAEHLAHYLHDKWGICVSLCHREQHISQTLD